MIVPGILICSSFFINVYMSIGSKTLFISCATVLFVMGNPFSTMLFSVCSAITVE